MALGGGKQALFHDLFEALSRVTLGKLFCQIPKVQAQRSNLVLDLFKPLINLLFLSLNLILVRHVDDFLSWYDPADLSLA